MEQTLSVRIWQEVFFLWSGELEWSTRVLFKTVYAKSAWEHGYSLKEIACHIVVSSVAVFKYINKTINKQ